MHYIISYSEVLVTTYALVSPFCGPALPKRYACHSFHQWILTPLTYHAQCFTTPRSFQQVASAVKVLNTGQWICLSPIKSSSFVVTPSHCNHYIYISLHICLCFGTCISTYPSYWLFYQFRFNMTWKAPNTGFSQIPSDSFGRCSVLRERNNPTPWIQQAINSFVLSVRTFQ